MYDFITIVNAIYYSVTKMIKKDKSIISTLKCRTFIAILLIRTKRSADKITVSTLLVWKANGFYARGSVIAFKIAPPSKGGGSHNFMHSKQYKFCKISDWICTVK